MEVCVVPSRIVHSHRGSWFHWIGRYAADHEIQMRYMSGAGKGVIDRTPISKLQFESDVAGCLMPDFVGSGRQRRMECRKSRQLIKLRVDQLGGVSCGIKSLGNDRGNWFACISDAPLRDQSARRLEHGLP